MKLSTNLISRGSKISGCASILGSWQICHNVCTSLIAALATIGIAVQGMPLLFLNKWQWPLWIAAVALFGVLLIVKAKLLPAAQHKSLALCITTRGVFGNVGLLMAGAPFVDEAIGPIRLIGLIIVLVVLLWWLKDLVVRRQESGWVIDLVEQGRKVIGGMVGVVAVTMLIVSNTSSLPSPVLADILSRGERNTNSISSPLGRGQGEGRMKFTLFDIAQAKEMMDKNGDGKCDACGMAIDQCIESGMMQCTMDPEAKIGLLGSQHIHARFKVVRGGQSIDLAPFAHTMDAQGGGTGSSFIHVEGPDFNKLHMHATGVPLKMWFESVKLDADGAVVNVNGAQVPQGLDYIFQDNDIIEVRLAN